MRRSRRDAALKVQRTVRGLKGRTVADHERRKLEAAEQRAFEEEQEAELRLSRAASRPRRAQTKATHGF